MMIASLILARAFGRASGTRASVLLACFALALPVGQAYAQSPQAQTSVNETAEEKLKRLAAAVEQVQIQAAAYQRQLAELQKQLAEVQQQLAASKEQAPGAPGSVSAGAVEDLSEQQAVQASQIATHEVSKVETDSKYPLKLSGLILFNSFVNTSGVDSPVSPTYATPSSGSTGFSLRQSVLGLDARGPHLLGASSHADVRVDFSGGSYSPNGYGLGGLLRLRTAHADLTWKRTEVFFSLDRSLLAPLSPSSLLAVAQPELAWIGNLWTWNPQVGVKQTWNFGESNHVLFQAALIDVADPQLPHAAASLSNVSSTERSRWPGTEARVAWTNGTSGEGPEFGVGGYFSPHKTSEGARFDAWAGSLDARLPLGKYIEWTANAYRGVALGGLGGGGYVDYFYQSVGTNQVLRPLNDVGGWTQLKLKPTQRIEFNAGYGLDNPFAKEIHFGLSPPGSSSYNGLSRNASVFSNVIYSPSTYLLFSLEYRRLWSTYANGSTYRSDAIGLGAGYRF